MSFGRCQECDVIDGQESRVESREPDFSIDTLQVAKLDKLPLIHN